MERSFNSVHASKIYSAHKIRKLADHVEQQGASVARLLHGTGLSRSELADETLKISRSQLIRAYRNANRMAQGRSWGLDVGLKLGVTDYGFYGFALISSSSLRRALEFSIKYHQLATPTVAMSLSIDERSGRAAFGLQDILLIPEIYRFNIEMQIGLVFTLFRDMVGQEFHFRSASLRYEASEHSESLGRVLGCPVHYNQPENSLVFDAKLADLPLRRANFATWEATRRVCDSLLETINTSTPVTQMVYDVITKDLHAENTVGSISTSLGMSDRTLRRRLQAEGTSVRSIKQQVRMSIAEEYLQKTDMTAEEIAERIGFSDGANFRAAVKKWSGMNLSEFRTQPPGKMA